MNHKLNLLTILCFLFLFSFFLVVFEARAEEIKLSVAPQKFDLVILAGDSYQGWFKLANRSQIALPVSLRAIPFGAEDKTGEMRFESAEPGSPSFWIKFETSELILKPGEARRLRFNIKVPANVEAGGYYFFVHFEPRFPSYYFEDIGSKNVGSKVVPIIGVPFLISTKPLLLEAEKGREFEVAEFSISEEERVLLLENVLENVIKKFGFGKNIVLAEGERAEKNISIQIVKSQPTKFSVRIKNNDIYHIKPAGTLSIYDALGNKLGETELPDQTILPQKSRHFNIVLAEKKEDFKYKILSSLPFKYSAELELWADSPVREKIKIKENPSLVFFSLNSFYFLAVFLIIILLTYFGRKRIKASLTALLKK